MRVSKTPYVGICAASTLSCLLIAITASSPLALYISFAGVVACAGITFHIIFD